MLQINLHLDTSLIRRTSGRSLWNFKVRSFGYLAILTIKALSVVFNNNFLLVLHILTIHNSYYETHAFGKVTLNTKILKKDSLDEMFSAHCKDKLQKRAISFASSRVAERIFMKLTKIC
jgi:hypothetical protein